MPGKSFPLWGGDGPGYSVSGVQREDDPEGVWAPDRRRWADQHHFNPWDDVQKALGELPLAYAIVDLDGTLCNDSPRAHLARQHNWAEYHARLTEDVCYPAVVLIVRLLLERGISILYLTSRPQQYEEATHTWLNINFLWWPGRTYLRMRPDDNAEPSVVLKKRIYEQWCADHPGWHPLLALEDKDSVCHLWRSIGIPCFQTREDYYRHGQ